MFNKSNTVGFLHVSHYLSSIYDTKLFKQMVKWPISCKKDEATYRVEMKNFLCLVSRDNPDLNFPSILISHLLQSGGIKFQIIMWKLSQLALRTYMKRELQGELLNVPCTSPVQSLIITYFNNTIEQKHSVMTDTHKKMEKTLKATNNFLNNEIETLNMYKSEIFDRKENIKKLVLELPANPLIQKRLIDHLIRNLYANDSIVFSTLLSLLYLVFVKILHHENIDNLSDLSQCLLFVQNARKRMKSLQTLFSKYKHLFKRHKRKYRPLCELSATLLDLSKSWNNMSGWLSPRVHSVKCEQILFKGKPLSPLYSRLLHHSKLNLKRSRENVSHNPSMNYEGLNLTPRKRPLQAEHPTSKTRNLFSSPS
ncbi:hypothetical protein ALC57_10905 [Trachymyrmex cornetzi]|uniref:HAUS augmin-like complex subunit 6 N-terminal domain-containing protein n=1 Tax=Trachymyrmex cornetzi TaxID=471704 RepID=A0A151J3C2_9HYME|nr:hypothetical protein ALC57_10905 [Trachymyrmex cornetzi]